MTQKPKSPEIVPKIETCPQCGHHILIGDTYCSNCGYRLNNMSVEDRLKRQPPNVVAAIGAAVGSFIGIAALSTDGVLQIVLLLISLGAFLTGGFFYAAHLLLWDDTKRKEPPKTE